jgi:5-methylcytosine-specific restriction endonuclease McrA
MPSKKLVRIRSNAYLRQSGRCCYCGVSMWTKDPRSFARAHGITLAQARWHQCTAEHLLARQEGGPDSAANIAAACKRCNLWRHRGKRQPPEPERYREIVQQRMSRRRWPAWVFSSPTLAGARGVDDRTTIPA